VAWVVIGTSENDDARLDLAARLSVQASRGRRRDCGGRRRARTALAPGMPQPPAELVRSDDDLAPLRMAPRVPRPLDDPGGDRDP